MTQHTLDPAACERSTSSTTRRKKLDNLFFSRLVLEPANGFIALVPRRSRYRSTRVRARDRRLPRRSAIPRPARSPRPGSPRSTRSPVNTKPRPARLDALNRPATADDFPADEPAVIASATLALRLGDAEAALADLEMLSFAEDECSSSRSGRLGRRCCGEPRTIALGDDEAAGDALEAGADSMPVPPLDNPWLSAATIVPARPCSLDIAGQLRDVRAPASRSADRAPPGIGFLPGVVDSLEALAQLAADGESASGGGSTPRRGGEGPWITRPRRDGRSTGRKLRRVRCCSSRETARRRRSFATARGPRAKRSRSTRRSRTPAACTRRTQATVVGMGCADPDGELRWSRSRPRV